MTLTEFLLRLSTLAEVTRRFPPRREREPISVPGLESNDEGPLRCPVCGDPLPWMLVPCESRLEWPCRRCGQPLRLEVGMR